MIALGDVMAGGFVLINLPRFSPDIEWLLCGRAQRCSEDLRRPFGEAGGPNHCTCAGERSVAERTCGDHLAKREARDIALGDVMAGMFVLINLPRFYPAID